MLSNAHFNVDFFQHINSILAPPKRTNNKVSQRVYAKSDYPHTGNVCLNSSQFWSVRFSVQDEAMDVAQSVSQGTHNQATKAKQRNPEEISPTEASHTSLQHQHV